MQGIIFSSCVNHGTTTYKKLTKIVSVQPVLVRLFSTVPWKNAHIIIATRKRSLTMMLLKDQSTKARRKMHRTSQTGHHPFQWQGSHLFFGGSKMAVGTKNWPTVSILPSCQKSSEQAHDDIRSSSASFCTL